MLRRRAPRKADYLKYIFEELQLEKLRELRTKKQKALERERMEKLGRLDEFNQSNTGKNRHIGDSHIIQNVHLLFRRALRRYNKEDVSVYLEYAEVCNELKSYTKLPQVYAEAVQIHPHCTGLWIEAASHEFFFRQSVSAARILLQRALRINKKAQDLWLQSFALEFHYIAKMQGRRTLLHAETDDRSNDTKEESISPTLFAVVKIVYDSAVEAIPEDVAFRLRFLDLCQNFPYTETIEAHIFKTIRKDFKNDPKAWITRAAHIMEKQDGGERGEKATSGFTMPPQNDDSTGDEEESKEDSSSEDERPAKRPRTTEKDDSSATINDPVLALIQKAIRALGSNEMYLESVRFLWKYWENAGSVCSGDAEDIESKQQEILHFIKDLLDEAASQELSIYDVSLALEHANFYTRVDQAERGRQVLADFKGAAVGANIRMTAVWLQLAELTFQMQSAAAACAVLKEALKHVSISDPDYLRILLHILGAELVNKTTDKIRDAPRTSPVETFQQVLLLAGGGAVNVVADAEEEEGNGTLFGIKSVEQACWQFLLHMIEAHGPIEGVRKTCKLVLHQSNYLEHPTRRNADLEALVAFFDKCLELEIGNLKRCETKPSSQRKKDKLCVQQLSEAARRVFKNIPSLATKFQQQRLEASLL